MNKKFVRRLGAVINIFAKRAEGAPDFSAAIEHNTELATRPIRKEYK
jgi:hypothetical protein